MPGNGLSLTSRLSPPSEGPSQCHLSERPEELLPSLPLPQVHLCTFPFNEQLLNRARDRDVSRLLPSRRFRERIHETFLLKQRCFQNPLIRRFPGSVTKFINKNMAFIAIESNCSLLVTYKLVNAIKRALHF